VCVCVCVCARACVCKKILRHRLQTTLPPSTFPYLHPGIKTVCVSAETSRTNNGDLQSSRVQQETFGGGRLGHGAVPKFTLNKLVRKGLRKRQHSRQRSQIYNTEVVFGEVNCQDGR
jgi:hypothetical protein